MEKLDLARETLHKKEGDTALTLLDEILEEDETCEEAWFLAMQCFQFLYPLDQLEAKDELACARYAIRYAPKEKKHQRQLVVYRFLLDKAKGVLEQDIELLADGKELLSFYQRETYFDAAGAPRKTFEKDQSFLEAVMHTLDYCEELFVFIPGSQIKRNASLNRMARDVADCWQKAWGYLTLRMGLYRMSPKEDEIRKALKVYASMLKNVKNGEEILKVPLPFNTIGVDPLSFWE